MFGAASVVQNGDKIKYVFADYEIAFDGTSLWGFGKDLARNVVIFGNDNSSSSYTDN